MTHPQVFGQKFTPIRRFSAWNTHPFWPHIPNMTQYVSAPPPGKDYDSKNAQQRKMQLRIDFYKTSVLFKPAFYKRP